MLIPNFLYREKKSPMYSSTVANKDFDEGSILEGVPLMVDFKKEDALLPDPELLEFYNDLKNRVIYIDDDIVDPMAMEVQRLIVAWNREDAGIPAKERKPIKVMIYTCGGSVYAMNNIIDVIMMSKTPVYTYNVGIAFSAGLDILLAGQKRFCFPKSSALLHQGANVIQGTSVQVQDNADNYKRQLKEYEEWVLSRTKITKALYTKKKKNEWFLTAQEQVELGVVDAIVQDLDEIL